MRGPVSVAVFETRHRRIDGSEFDVQVIGQPVTFDGQLATLVVCQNISERVRSEVALRESEARLRAIMDHSPVAIFLKGRDQRFLAVNPAYCQRRGVPADQVIGATVTTSSSPPMPTW